MSNNHGGKFSDGFLLGIMVGAAAVFLFGTKTGKNLVKILSEQGLSGISDILQEYNLGNLEEDDLEDQDEAFEEPIDAQYNSKNHEEKVSTSQNSEEKPSKKRFFRRVKK